MIYNKLYTKRIDFPKIIPQTGLTSTMESNYYILLEKNYLPISSNISKKIITQTGTSNWLKINNISLTPHDNYYNKLSIIGTITANNNTTKNTALVEFSATNIDESKAIEKCNVLLAYFEQAPKEEIKACIDIIPYNNQTLNGDTLSINGDEQYIKFYYYGLKNGVKLVSQNNINIKINGNDLNENNIISKNVTSNGIEIIYNLPEVTNNTTYDLTCTYNTEYNTFTETKHINQSANIYEIQLIDPHYSLPAIISDYVILNYYVKKNNIPITSGVSLKINFIPDIPTIKYSILNTIFNSETNQFETKLKVESNFSTDILQLQAYVKYKDYISNTIIITQNGLNTSQIQLHIECEEYEISGNTLYLDNGSSKTLHFIYYATYNGTQFINMPITKNGITTNNYIYVSDISNDFTILEDKLYKTAKPPYGELTIILPENTSASSISGSFTVKLLENTKTLNISQGVTTITCDIDTDYSTTTIGGLAGDFNTVKIKLRYIVNGKYVTDPTKIKVSGNFANSYTIDQTVPDYIIYKFNITTLYRQEFTNYENYPANGHIPITYLTYIFTYNNNESSQTIYRVTRYPIYFGSKIECRDLELNTDTTPNYYLINGIGQTVSLYYYGIMYNSRDDQEHYEYFTLLYSSGSMSNLSCTSEYVELSDRVTRTATYAKSDAIFKPNNTHDILSIQIFLRYKGSVSFASFKMSAINTGFIFYVSDIGYWNENAVWDPETDTINDVIYDIHTTGYPTVVYINPLRRNIIKCCAKLIFETGEQQDITELGTIDMSFVEDTYDLIFDVEEDSHEIIEGEEYAIYYINEQYNINQPNNLPHLILTYTNTFNGETYTSSITIKKKTLTYDFFFSFNPNSIVRTKTISQFNQTLLVYGLFSFIVEDENIKKDEIENIYNYKIYKNYNDPDSTMDITIINPSDPSALGPPTFIDPTISIPNTVIAERIYRNDINRIQYSLAIPTNTSTNDVTLILNGRYLDEYNYNPGIDVRAENITLIQEKQIYGLTYRLSDNVYSSSDSDDYYGDLSLDNYDYWIRGCDPEFYIYIKCTENGEPLLDENNNINISFLIDTTANGSINYENYDSITNEYIFKVKCKNVAALIDKLYFINIKWKQYNEQFSVVQELGWFFMGDIVCANEISAKNQNLTIKYYISLIPPIGNNTKFNPFDVYGNNVEFVLTALFYEQGSTTPNVSKTQVFNNRTPDENNIFTALYHVDSNTGANTNMIELSLECNIGDPTYTESLGVIAYKEVIQRIGELEYFMDILPINATGEACEIDGEEQNITVVVYAKVNNIITEIPSNISIRITHSSVNWILDDAVLPDENHKKRYQYTIAENINTDPDFTDFNYPSRTCTFKCTFTDTSAETPTKFQFEKEVYQRPKWVGCVIDYTLL